jgi:hypothetical protein
LQKIGLSVSENYDKMRTWVSQIGFHFFKASELSAACFHGITLRRDIKERRASHELAITQQHRELWTYIYKRPELSRMLDPNADLARTPVTHEEEMFIFCFIGAFQHGVRAIEAQNVGRAGRRDCARTSGGSSRCRYREQYGKKRRPGRTSALCASLKPAAFELELGSS